MLVMFCLNIKLKTMGTFKELNEFETLHADDDLHVSGLLSDHIIVQFV